MLQNTFRRNPLADLAELISFKKVTVLLTLNSAHSSIWYLENGRPSRPRRVEVAVPD